MSLHVVNYLFCHDEVWCEVVISHFGILEVEFGMIVEFTINIGSLKNGHKLSSWVYQNLLSPLLFLC